MKRISVYVVLLALSCVQAFAGTQEAIAEGIRFHDLAQTEPDINIEKGKALLEPLKDSHPLAKGYYGSLLTIEASVHEKNKDVIKAMDFLNQGTALMDEAVASEPASVDLHMLRMINSYELSVKSPMNRFKVMKGDLDWLEANRASLDKADQGSLYLYKGLYLLKARRLDSAIEAFESCVRLSPGSPEAIEARKQLARYAE